MSGGRTVREALIEALRRDGWGRAAEADITATVLPVVEAECRRRAAEACELAALIVENATGIGWVDDEQLGRVAQSIRSIPTARADAIEGRP